MENNEEGSRRDLILDTSQNFPGGTEENNE
jgi:hypothetical protein